MYNPLHEAPKEKFIDVMNSIIKEKTAEKKTNLHILLKQAGLTQKELADLLALICGHCSSMKSAQKT